MGRIGQRWCCDGGVGDVPRGDVMNTRNNCRLCKDRALHRPLLRYGIRHYCHAECGFSKWGDEFLNKIPAHEIGGIPFRLILDSPSRRALASKLCPLMASCMEGLQVVSDH